jgi:tetratricopeptide (TPR) repeat protein/CheY-like chemotaxis protein
MATIRVLCAAGILLALAPTVGFSQSQLADLNFETARPEPDASRLRAEIGDKLAKLNLPPHPAETPTVKAAQARKAIEQGDFAAARQVIRAALGESKLRPWRFYPFEPFIIDVPDVRGATFGKKLDDWVGQAAGDPIPLLVRAQYYFNAGWSRRGPYFVSATPSDNLDAFTDYMTRALKGVDAAIKLDSTNPYSYRLKLAIMSDLGRPDAKTWFTAAIAAYPDYFTLYFSMLSYLTPKWGGSAEAMYQFVDYYAGRAPEHSPLKMLYLALYDDLLEDAWNTCDSAANRDADLLAPCVATHMKKAGRPLLDEQVQKALQLYDHYDHQEYNVILRTLLGDMLKWKGGEPFSDPIVQKAATVTQSGTEIAGNGQSHNDYVIGELAAVTWNHKLLLDNSIEKMKEALRDLESTNFADPGEKAGETAYIYNQLAMYSDLKSKYLSRLRQRANLDDTYVDMIVYETAAAALSKSARNEHLACYGYAQLRLYGDTIRSCSEVLANDDNVGAHFWRGIAYRYTNKLPEALRDLETVADSNDRELPPAAAIQMSQIYVETKDFKSLLDLIDAHRFFFDPMWAGFAYETRCRAHMELGELQKALNDCTAALQIVSSPQAQRLQQELLERLGKPQPAAVSQPPSPSAQKPPEPGKDGYPHLSSQVLEDIKTKIRSAGFQPNGIAIVYDLEDWHREFTAAHPYAKMLDVPMPSLKEAVEVVAHFAQEGLAFAAKGSRPPRFHVMLVDERERQPDDRVLDKHTWGTLGISIVQAHSVAEVQNAVREGAPDVILIAATSPEETKGEIQSKITTIPTITMPIPVQAASQQVMVSAAANRAPEAGYEQALLGFEEAVFDALQKTISAERPVYVSFATR